MDITGGHDYSPAVTRTPGTTTPARAKLERVRCFVGLAVAVLLCLMMVPESLSALVSRGISARDGAPVEVEIERSEANAPAVHHADLAPPSTSEFLALEEEESKEKDAVSDTQAFAGFSVLDRDPPRLRRWVLGHVVTGNSGHLSVSTGLGRGPPLG